MSTTPQGNGDPQVTGERAQPPIRWPHPDGATLGMVGVWVFGVMVALFVPALIVPPGADTAPGGKVLLAFSFTLLGPLMLLAAGWGLFRRTHDSTVLTLGVVPAVACVVGGLVLAAAKFYGIGT
jgi:hypothetical protein